MMKLLLQIYVSQVDDIGRKKIFDIPSGFVSANFIATKVQQFQVWIRWSDWIMSTSRNGKITIFFRKGDSHQIVQTQPIYKKNNFSNNYFTIIWTCRNNIWTAEKICVGSLLYMSWRKFMGKNYVKHQIINFYQIFSCLIPALQKPYFSCNFP